TRSGHHCLWAPAMSWAPQLRQSVCPSLCASSRGALCCELFTGGFVSCGFGRALADGASVLRVDGSMWPDRGAQDLGDPFDAVTVGDRTACVCLTGAGLDAGS